MIINMLLSNQYAKDTNYAKMKDMVQEVTGMPRDFIDKLLEKSVRTSNLFELEFDSRFFSTSISNESLFTK
jgi:hypothetical protein